MITILAESRKGLLKNHRTITWKSSNKLPESSTETFWLIKTNFRLQTLVDHWKFLWFLGKLPNLEMRCLIDFPSVLRDDLFVALLRAKLTDVSSKDLLKRFNFLLSLEERELWSIESLQARHGDLKYECFEMRKPIRKVKKFTGYIKSPSSMKSTRGKFSIPDPETFEWSESNKIDYYEFLTVGRFSGLSVEISFLP